LLLRISLIFLFFASFLFADLKLFATKAKEYNDTIVLQNPVIFYKNSIIQAKEGIIKHNREIILKKNVVVFYKNSILHADLLRAFSSENINLNDVFFYDRKLDGWITSKTSVSKKNKIFFNKLYFSTCCANDPDWYIKANSATFDKNNKSLKLYNLVLVINKVPVLYLPYFYANFNKTRRSGLLRPYIGFSENEGILYSQPIYIVTSINTDLEITPTIRTNRGKGVYSTFRFVDSPNSKGYLKVGEFIDNDSYYIQNNLANKKHYGFNLRYDKSKIFFNKDSLYVNLKYANDLDYFYLDAYNYKFNDVYYSDKLITSEINYVQTTNSSLYGTYLKYFIDTTQLSNDQTWQILPQLNYHKFLSKNSGIMNLIDVNVYNYYRKLGSNFVFTDILMPVSINKTFFNDYLKLKITETLSSGYGFYYQENSKSSKYFSLSTQFKLYSSLTKTDGYLHIINPSLIINIKNYTNEEINSDLINVPDIQNYVSFNLFQIFEKGALKLNHTLNETYYLNTDKYADMENKLNINYKDYSLEENNKYSVQQNKITYNNIKISYNNDKYNAYASHVYQQNVSESYILGMKYNINTYKKLYAEYSYDLDNKYIKYWFLGVKLNKKCWSYDLSFKQTRIPILEESGISYRRDNIISVNVNLRPLGGLNQTFIFKGK